MRGGEILESRFEGRDSPHTSLGSIFGKNVIFFLTRRIGERGVDYYDDPISFITRTRSWARNRGTYWLHPLDAGKIGHTDKSSYAEDTRFTRGREHYRFPLTVSRGRAAATILVRFVLASLSRESFVSKGAAGAQGTWPAAPGKRSAEGMDALFGDSVARLQETLAVTRSRARSARIWSQSSKRRF